MTQTYQRQFYLYFSSQDSSHIHLSNSSKSFVYELPSQIFLHGEWEVALVEYSLKLTKQSTFPDTIQLLTDIVTASPFKHNFLQVLRQDTFRKKSILPPEVLDLRYVPIINPIIDRIKVEVLLETKSGDIQINTSHPCNIVLHFQKAATL